jgi:hypothetical protein
MFHSVLCCVIMAVAVAYSSWELLRPVDGLDD